ncbi:5-carboxymethyl-2-hydroxymuconate semialdehyde dehydrogenase [Thermaerobacter sp. FW80]|uniref:5-carboxymethyl-2-hydroxymuconate semialdehyde dehydrogenase n=1 Tax=Thermaerobacter sp. FW80 TaxID=2546351 RepID=UPI001FAA0095|nr:5-carboxymethyl-2-hydroxymuconate semialdehyde dehydrogenase [Thermaerobacter sp. FW80]
MGGAMGEAVHQQGQGAGTPAAAVPRQALHFIGGRFVPGKEGRFFTTLNPATNRPLAEVAEGSPDDVDAAVQAARRAFDEGPWPRMLPAERARYLERIADRIEARSEAIARVEVLDTGMPISQARGQATRAAENFRFFARRIQDLGGHVWQVGDRFVNYVVHKPVGVAGLITPWNTPFMLATWKVAPCLAAGNTCVLKPAEWAPLSAHLLAEIVAEAGLPEGVFNVVHGFGEPAGASLVAHPAVNLISFTGETTTGKAIMANGAATLKRYSFELGGKSPVVIFADADLERAVDAAVFGVFSLNGERCTAGSRLLVEEPVYRDVVEAVARRAARIRIGDPADPRTELGPLIHPEHWRRVMGYVEAGRAEGAELLTGGRRPPGLPPELAGGNYLEATVFAGARPGMRVFQEEIFGPVVVATPFRTEDEAVRLANAVRYGLAAYVWTRDVGRAHRVGQAIDAGMVWLNSQNVRDLRTPFGGMKDSGIGREGGDYSFEFYCERQVIHVALGEHPIPRFGAG